MASRKDLVSKVWTFTEKTPFAQATQAQRELVLNDVNRAVGYVYNNGDLSFKTVIVRGFVYTVQVDPTAVSRGTKLPYDFMGFHQTGGIYMEQFTPKKKIYHYLPYHEMIDRIEGWGEQMVRIPTHYSLGGPSLGDDSSPDYGVYPATRELLLWPKPPTPTINLTLVYQRKAPIDGTTVEDSSATDWTKEIVPIPETWHNQVILPMAILFRKQDKNADETAAKDLLATAMRQMGCQEPHGREKPSRRPVHPVWRS